MNRVVPDRLLEVVDVDEWTRPLPGNDPLAVQYFQRCADGQLCFEECGACGHRQHYPRGICVECGVTPQLVPASGRGTVYTFSIVRQNGVSPFNGLVPYVLALIDLEEGPRLMGNILGCEPEQVVVGAQVRAFIQRANPSVGIPQWRLAT